MSFAARAVISLLSGIGAGTLGFAILWRLLIGTAFDDLPGPGYDNWLVAGIFVPGVLVPLVVFAALNRPQARPAVAPKPITTSAAADW